MTKIVIDTPTLKALLVDHPEVEVEILGVAAEKIAEEFKRKMQRLPVEEVVEKMVAGAEAELWTYAYSGTLRAKVGEVVKLAAQNIAEVEYTAAMRTALDEVIKRNASVLEARLSKEVRNLRGFDMELITAKVDEVIKDRLNAMSTLVGRP